MSARSIPLLVAALAAIGFLAAPQSAFADPKPIEVYGKKYGHSGGHYKAGCRTIYKFGRRQSRKIVICDGPGYYHRGPKYRAPRFYYGGPRYWVPGYGPKRRYGPPPQRYYKWKRRAPWYYGAYEHDTGRTAPVCDTTLLSGLVGGVSGALLGSQVGDGDGRVAATAVGTLIGAVAGLSVGESLDRACLADALEHAPDGHTIHWNNSQAADQPWQVTPNTTYESDDGRYCREFTHTATIGGEQQQTYGRACRQPDGDWEIVS